MLFTTYCIFTVITIVYLCAWLIAVIRYVRYNRTAKNYDLRRAYALGHRAASIRRNGWLLYLTIPLWTWLFPWVTVVSPTSEDSEVNHKKNISSYGLYTVKKGMAPFFFEGTMIGKGDYVFNNTDSVLNFYHTKFRKNSPTEVDDIDEGTFIEPGCLVKIPHDIDEHFGLPDPHYVPFTPGDGKKKPKKKEEVKDVWTLDVLLQATKHKQEIKNRLIFENSPVPEWEIQERAKRIFKEEYEKYNIPHKDEFRINDSVHQILLRSFEGIHHSNPSNSSKSSKDKGKANGASMSAKDSAQMNYKRLMGEFDKLPKDPDSITEWMIRLHNEQVKWRNQSSETTKSQTDNQTESQSSTAVSTPQSDSNPKSEVESLAEDE